MRLRACSVPESRNTIREIVGSRASAVAETIADCSVRTPGVNS